VKQQPPEALLLLFLIALGVLSGLSFLQPFSPYECDTWPHIVRTQIVYSEFFTKFRVPIWSFFFYCGYPLLQFYGPLYYYIAGLVVSLTGGDVFTGTKCVLFVCHVASAISMYYFAREVFRNRNAAFTAAIAYLLTYWHLYQILLMARYPLAFFYVLLPCAFLSLELLIRTGSRRHAMLMAVTTALLILTHIGYACFGVLFMGVWLVFRLVQSPERQFAGRVLRLSAVALLGALLLSSALLLPYVLESPPSRTTVAVGEQPVLPASLLVWWETGRLPPAGRYLGLSLLALALVGVLQGIKTRAREFKPILACTLLALILTLSKGRIGILDSLPLLAEFEGSRFLIYSVTFLPLLAAGSYLWVERRVSRRSALLLCSILLVGDLLPMSLVMEYRRTSEFLGPRCDYYERLRQDSTDSRLLDLGSSLDEPFDYGRLWRYAGTGFMFAGRPSPLGFYRQFAAASTNYVYQWANEVGRDFGDATADTVSTATTSVLHLLGVGHVIMPTGIRRGGSDVALARKKGVGWDTLGLGSPVLPALLCVVDSPSHTLATNVVRPWPPARMAVSFGYLVPSDWRALLDSSVVDPQTHTLRAIWSRDGLSDSLPGSRPEVTVARSMLQHQRVELDLDASKECYLRLPFSYFPTLKLSIDDRSATIHCGADRFIFVKVPAGRHRLVLVPALSRVRKLAIALNLAAILGLVGLAFWTRRSRQVR